MDQAARAYLATYLTGRSVLLMAADWARCRELSARIREDLIHLGLVDRGPAIRIVDGAQASAGDLIICRANDHRLEAGEPGRALANGDVLRVEAITRRGVMVRRLLDPDRATGQRRFTDRAFRYTGYQSSDLAYAVTGHSAQGATVHTGITLVAGTEDRQWLYPAMTRGTDVNLAYVFTTPARPADPQPGIRAAPGLDRYKRIRHERAGSPLPGPRPTPAAWIRGSQSPCSPTCSAAMTPSCRRRRSGGGTWPTPITLPSCTRCGPPRPQSTRTAVPRTGRRRIAGRLPAAAIPPGPVAVPYPARRRAGRVRPGRRPPHRGDLPGLGRGPDIAAVLDARIRPRTGQLLPHPQGPWTHRVPQLPDSERRAYLAEIAALMDDRTRRLGQHAVQAAPAWALAAVGPIPGNAAARRDWERKASPIAAYRETYGYDQPSDPIGPEPSRDTPDQRAAWHQALAALGPASGPPVRTMPDGELWLLRDTYVAVTAWAPPHPGKELRLARLGAFDAALGTRRADA
jgi:hypothetical protein